MNWPSVTKAVTNLWSRSVPRLVLTLWVNASHSERQSVHTVHCFFAVCYQMAWLVQPMVWCLLGGQHIKIFAVIITTRNSQVIREQAASPEFCTRIHAVQQSACSVSFPPISSCKFEICPPPHGRSGLPSNTWFTGPTQSATPDSISIESAIFPQIKLATSRPMDRQNDDGTQPVRFGRLRYMYDVAW